MQLQMTSAGSIVALSGTKASVDHGRVRRRDYQTLKVLGTGSKATVKLAVRVSDGRQVALKSIRKPGVATKNGAGVGPAVGGVEAGHGAGAQTDNLPPSPDPPVDGGDGNNNAPAGGDFAAAEREWRTEVRALEMVGNHENMPALVEAFETGSKWYIAMDYQRGGDLFSRLAVMGQFTELHASAVIATIVNAVHFLHCHGIAHRDLKPANLLMKDESENSNLSIVDFGAGFVMDAPDFAATGWSFLAAGRPQSSTATLPGRSQDLHQQSMKTITGTPFYLAPEIVVGQPYTTKVDMWSIGCIAYQLLVGVTPFQASTSFEQLYQRIVVGDYSFPDDVPLSDLAKDFVRCLLIPDPDLRFSAGQAMRHPWIRQAVPAGYLLLLLEFNHEADPRLFLPPSIDILNDMGSTSALWGLRPHGPLQAAGVPAQPFYSQPQQAGPPVERENLGSDSTLGRTVRTRWEQHGRPGVLQVPVASYSEEEAAAAAASGQTSDLNSSSFAGAFESYGAQFAPVNHAAPDLIDPIKRVRTSSGAHIWRAASGGLQMSALQQIAVDQDMDHGMSDGVNEASDNQGQSWYPDTTTYFGTPQPQPGQLSAPAGAFIPGMPNSWTPIWDGQQPPQQYDATRQFPGTGMGGEIAVPEFLQYQQYANHTGQQMDSPATEINVTVVPLSGYTGAGGADSPDSQPSVMDSTGRTSEVTRVRGLLHDLAFGQGQQGMP